MNIALLAHDNKKELMIQFCAAYSGILSYHDLYAPTTTGKLISNATGLPVTLFLPCNRGGSQQIGHRIACGEIDVVLFFCDVANEKNIQDINHIFRLCDKHMIPYASNVVTAEILLQGLMYGGFDWRQRIKPSLL